VTSVKHSGVVRPPIEVPCWSAWSTLPVGETALLQSGWDSKLSDEESPEILFLCVHNAGSAMAAGFARLSREPVVVHSAGRPGETLNLRREVIGKGIDITSESPRKLTDEMGLTRRLVTMGCARVSRYPVSVRGLERWIAGKESMKFVRFVTILNGEFETSSPIFLVEIPKERKPWRQRMGRPA